MSKFNFRGRSQYGKGCRDMGPELAAEQVPGLKAYDVWEKNEIVGQVRAGSHAAALTAAGGKWVSIRLPQ